MGMEGPSNDSEVIVGAKLNEDGSLDTSKAMKMIDPVSSGQEGVSQETPLDWRQHYLDFANLSMAERKLVENMDPKEEVPKWLFEKLEASKGYRKGVEH